jgi:hypothetical protein
LVFLKRLKKNVLQNSVLLCGDEVRQTSCEADSNCGVAVETWRHLGHASSPPLVNPMAPVTTLVSWWYNRDVIMVEPGMRASHRAIFLIKRKSSF